MNFYVYDFDGTIYDGDSTVDFLKYLMNKKKKLLLHIPKMGYYFLKYKLNKITKEETKQCFYEVFKNFDDIEKEVEEFWKIHEKNIKRFFKNKESHKNDIIASASPEFLLKPIADKYKIKWLFASPVDKKNGEYKGLNCHGEEKVRLIYEKYPKCIIEEMYTDDSKADGPLLREAKIGYIVKKDKIEIYNK